VKEFLHQKQIPFEERDVTRDPEALAELEAMGVFTTPVTVVDGTVVIGFDRARLEVVLEQRLAEEKGGPERASESGPEGGDARS
jgi:glutaredoxin